MHIVLELVIEAISEDTRENSRFDRMGFDAFFPEHSPHDVRDAWNEYSAILDGRKALDRVVAEYAALS